MSIIVLVGHLLPVALTSPAVTTPHSHYPLLHCHVLYQLYVKRNTVYVAEIFFPACGVLFNNHSTQLLTKMFNHLWG